MTYEMEFLGMIPVLMPARPSMTKPDGYAAVDKDGNRLAVWIVPPEATKALLGKPERQKLEKKFGRLTNRQIAGLFSTARYVDCVRDGQVDEKKFSQALSFDSVIAKEDAKEKGQDPEQAWREHIVWTEKFKRAVEDERSYALMVMTKLGPEYLEHVSFCIWECNGVLDVGLLADGFQVAIAIHLVLSLHQSEGIAICENEKCKATFRRDWPWEKHCSKRCAAAVRKRRQRAKAKLRSEHKTYLGPVVAVKNRGFKLVSGKENR